MSYEEYLQEVQFINFAVVFMNENLNPSNFDDPIQGIYNDKYTLLLDPTQNSYINFFLRK